MARSELASLPVGSLDRSHAYNRVGDFGVAWTDDNNDRFGHNGCDTRDDILERDLHDVTYRPGTHDCVVVTGTLADPYSGSLMTFVKARAAEIQIDHVVPLHAAWQLGAWTWSQQTRVDYANDPDVLLAVSGKLNEEKGDALADRWLPPNPAFRCTYTELTVAIHVKYRLPVTLGEKRALEAVLASC
ncbi:MAG: HNH endonuclease [Actinobacteria bacterium]|nr:HNH endonuclease [Actinomycetota bacterium]